MIETLDDIVEQIADWLGIYEDPECASRDDDGHTDKVPEGQCRCRVYWAPALLGRIEVAAKVELAIKRGLSRGRKQ